ncbi:MAG: HAD-IIA family hydrolase [Anaerolineaceae bacterium]
MEPTRAPKTDPLALAPASAVIFDIDGVLEYQGKVFPRAVETLERLRSHGLQIRFLTNSTLKSRASCAEKLRSRGFTAHDEEVVTASYATAAYLREQNAGSIWLMLEREAVDEFTGFQRDEEHPEYVVIGDNRSRFDFDHLNRALRLLAGGAALVGMSNELIDASMGGLELNVGSWAGMLERASGKKAVYIGKPFPYGFNLAVRGLSCRSDEVLVVGDRLNTDVQGAKNCGMLSALVKTGEYQLTRLHQPIKPDWVLDDVSGLLNLFNLSE